MSQFDELRDRIRPNVADLYHHIAIHWKVMGSTLSGIAWRLHLGEAIDPIDLHHEMARIESVHSQLMDRLRATTDAYFAPSEEIFT